MDVSNLFKATVKTVKARNKAQGISTPVDKSILHTGKTKTEFATKAKEVVTNIGKLKEFLTEHRKSYVRASSNVMGQGGHMTTAECDQIDSDAERFMRTCAETIKAFKKEVSSNKVLPQVREHRDAVFELIEGYLNAVCKIYSEQRAVRVKRVVDRKRLSRLEPEKKHHGMEPFKIGKHPVHTEQHDDADKPAKQQRMEESPPSFNEEEEEITAEEAQMFEEENRQLLEEMNTLSDEVRQIEGKVVEISRLQEVFAEKVLEQEVDINRVADVVVGSTENIKDANEEIREAMKNNAGLRVWILFFLIVCSFSLLFLDWYNP